MAGNGKSATLRILGNNLDAKEKLEELKRDYEELKAETDDPIQLKVIDSAYRSQLRQIAKDEFSGVSKDLEGIGDDAEESSGKVAGLGQKLMGLVNLGSNGGKGAGGLSGGLIPGLVAGAAALGPALVSAGAGLGIFGAVAVSAFQKVSAADQANKKLTGGLGLLQGSLKSVSSLWGDFVSKNSGGVANVISKGFGLVAPLLKELGPVLPPVEKALTGIIGALGKDIKTGPLSQLFQAIDRTSGSAVSSLGGALINVVNIVAEFAVKALPFSLAFAHLLELVTGGIARFGQLTHGIGIVIPVVLGLGAAILAITGPWGLLIAGVAVGATEIVKHWASIKHGFSDVFGWVKGHWPLLLGILTGPIGLAVVEIVKHWGQIESGAKSLLGKLENFFKSLPGRIVGALGDLGHLLWNAGTSILSGFLGGLEQKWHDVTNFVGGIASWISNHKGPIEYDATLLRPHGRVIMGGLVDGLQDGLPSLTHQLTRTTNVIANTRVPGIASSGGANAALTVEWVGGSGADQEFITWLKKNIRFRGGDPAILGR